MINTIIIIIIIITIIIIIIITSHFRHTGASSGDLRPYSGHKRSWRRVPGFKIIIIIIFTSQSSSSISSPPRNFLKIEFFQSILSTSSSHRTSKSGLLTGESAGSRTDRGQQEGIGSRTESMSSKSGRPDRGPDGVGSRTASISSKSGRMDWSGQEGAGSRTESMSSKSGGRQEMLDGSIRRKESGSSKSGKSSSRSSEVKRKESNSSYAAAGGRSDLTESLSSTSEARRRTESLSSSSSGGRISSSSEDSSRRMSLHPGLQSHRDSVTLQPQGSVLGRRDSEHRDSVSSYSGTIPGHRGSFSLRGGAEDLSFEGPSFSRSRSKSGGGGSQRRRRSRSGLESYSPPADNSPSLYSRTSRSEHAGSELYSASRRRQEQTVPGLYSGRSDQLPEMYSSNRSHLYSSSGMCAPEQVSSSELFPSKRLEQFADLYSVTKSRSENFYSDDLTLDPTSGRRTSDLADGEEARTQENM